MDVRRTGRWVVGQNMCQRGNGGFSGVDESWKKLQAVPMSPDAMFT